MALNQTRNWLIAYDIRAPRRLARVHRLLTQQAIAVQYSVFAARGSLADMRELAAALRQRIDERVDDVRIYQIPANPLMHTIGARLWPDDVWLLGAAPMLPGSRTHEAQAAGGEALHRRAASTRPEPKNVASTPASARIGERIPPGQRESQP